MIHPIPTRVQDTALYAIIARKYRNRIFPLPAGRMNTAGRLQRLKDAQKIIKQNLSQ